MNFFSFFRREFAYSRAQLMMYVLCVALSLVSVVALGAFDASVQQSLNRDAQELSGGDIVIRSSQPFSPDLTEEIDGILDQSQNTGTTLLGFPTVVYAPASDASLLSNIKSVDDAYPLYGNVVLESGREFGEVLTPGSLVIERNALERLGANVGDVLQIGEWEGSIADVITSIPDGGGNIFATGQTIIMRLDDAEQTQLIGARSRISYRQFLKIGNPQDVLGAVETLSAVAGERERVQSFEEAQTSTERFLEEFLFFLNLISLFTMILAGIGMMSTLSAYLRKRRQTIAVFKTMGMKNRNVMTIFLRLIFVLSVIGIGIGVLLGVITLSYLPALFGEFLPQDFHPQFQTLPLIEAIVLGLFVSGVFTALPLLQLREVKPVQVFRQMNDSSRPKGLLFWILSGIIALLFATFVVIEIGEVGLGLWFVVGCAALFLLLRICGAATLWIMKYITRWIPSLPVQLAGKGLLRPGSSAGLIMTALATALTILLSISLLEKNIVRQFVQAYPEDYPNVFLLDVQPDQTEALAQTVGKDLTFFPIIRGSLATHNNREINEQTQEEVGQRNDSVTRTFNLSYGDELSDNEILTIPSATGGIFDTTRSSDQMAQVSVLSEFGTLLNIQPGDVLVFLIQGVELPSQVVSIRERKQERVEPYFYFLFEESVMRDFPQTLFTTTKELPDTIPSLQNRVTREFPNVTTIDMTLIIERTTTLLAKLNVIIRFFTLFSLGAGVLLLISSLLATSSERIRETVYFKLLGVRAKSITRIALYEFLFLGMFAAVLGVICAEVAVWLITKYLLSITFSVFWADVLILTCSMIVLIVVVASMFLFPLLKKRPVDYLREHGEA